MSSRNIFSGNWITLRDLPPLVQFCQRHKRSLMIFGGAGIGKSQAVKQIADSLFGPGDNLVDFRLADKDNTDLTGVQIPYTDDNGVTRTVYALPDFWPRDPNWKGIVFLDELLHAEPYLQKLAFQIMLDRRIGTYQFPEGAVLVSAGNRSGDGTAVTPLEAPLANRMMLVELAYSATVFIEDFAMQNGVHSSIIGFLSRKNSAIENYEEMLDIGCPSYATPRTWVFASDVLYDYDAGLLSATLAKVALQGFIGTPLMAELWAYHTKLRNMVSIEDVMNGTAQDPGDLPSDSLWILGSEGAIWLRKAIADTNYTDDQIIEFSGNFLQYLYDHFMDQNRDFVSSIFLSFIKENAFGKALLTTASNRDKLPARLLKAKPIIMKIMADFQVNYAEDIKLIEGK